MDLSRVLFEEGVDVLTHTYHGLQKTWGLIKGIQQVPSVDLSQMPKEHDL